MAVSNRDRLRFVSQILRTMESDFEMDAYSDLWVDGGAWRISLPDDELGAVYLGFNPYVGMDLVIRIAIDFSVIATMMGMDVHPEGTIPSDSTSPVAGWLEQSDHNNK